MQLIYLYIDEYCNFQQEEFNFSPEVRRHFDSETYSITVSDTQFRLPEGFWGENINNLSAIVGNNGAGKTSLMQDIIEIFLYAHGFGGANRHDILIFGEGNKLYEYYIGWTDQPVRIYLKSSKYQTIQYLNRFDAKDVLGRTKLILSDQHIVCAGQQEEPE